MHHPLASGIRPRALADDPPLADAWPRRWYALLVSGFTAWVGCMGFFRPTDILRALPWPVPPLHARTVGALYLAATVFLWLAAASRQRLAGAATAAVAGGRVAARGAAGARMAADLAGHCLGRVARCGQPLMALALAAAVGADRCRAAAGSGRGQPVAGAGAKLA